MNQIDSINTVGCRTFICSLALSFFRLNSSTSILNFSLSFELWAKRCRRSKWKHQTCRMYYSNLEAKVKSCRTFVFSIEFTNRMSTPQTPDVTLEFVQLCSEISLLSFTRIQFNLQIIFPDQEDRNIHVFDVTSCWMMFNGESGLRDESFAQFFRLIRNKLLQFFNLLIFSVQNIQDFLVLDLCFFTFPNIKKM